MNSEFQKFVLLGGTGILGSGLISTLSEKNILRTSRSEIDSWFGSSGCTNMINYFSKLDKNATVINALGITDPKASIEDLEELNSLLPSRILRTLGNLDMKLITFGSILESNTTLASVNSYLKSKQDFFNRIQASPSTKNHLHLQLHTIYGSERSHRHMFIEQIFRSLRNKSEFVMSTGFQVREYHHIHDEVSAVIALIEKGHYGVLQLNAGNAIPINALATAVFNDFKQADLLKFNPALDGVEVFNIYYQKNPHLQFMSFRDPILGVIEYLKNKLSET